MGEEEDIPRQRCTSRDPYIGRYPGSVRVYSEEPEYSTRPFIALYVIKGTGDKVLDFYEEKFKRLMAKDQTLKYFPEGKEKIHYRQGDFLGIRVGFVIERKSIMIEQEKDHLNISVALFRVPEIPGLSKYSKIVIRETIKQEDIDLLKGEEGRR